MLMMTTMKDNRYMLIQKVHPMDYGKKMYRGSLLESSYKMLLLFCKNCYDIH